MTASGSLRGAGERLGGLMEDVSCLGDAMKQLLFHGRTKQEGYLGILPTFIISCCFRQLLSRRRARRQQALGLCGPRSPVCPLLGLGPLRLG